MAPATTIRDVARRADCLGRHRSRALNGHDNVTAETRQRVLDAAAALRFMPSIAARSLITRRTQTVGALLPDLHGEYFSRADPRHRGRGAQPRAAPVGVEHATAMPAEVAAALRAMRGRVDGLIVMSPHGDADFMRRSLPPALPAVLLNTRPGRRGTASLAVDNHGGACGDDAPPGRLAAIARSPSSPARRTTSRRSERLRGYRDALAAGAARQPADGVRRRLQRAARAGAPDNASPRCASGRRRCSRPAT